MQPEISSLPFQRLMRQIALKYCLQLRWTSLALLCLQEAMEDFMVKFFEDAYFLCAHAHRLTILPKDFNTLQVIYFKHDHLLRLVLVGDKRMADILTLPPLHPHWANQEQSLAAHNRNTCSHSTKVVRQDAPTVAEVPVDDVLVEIDVPTEIAIPTETYVPPAETVPNDQPPTDPQVKEGERRGRLGNGFMKSNYGLVGQHIQNKRF